MFGRMSAMLIVRLETLRLARFTFMTGVTASGTGWISRTGTMPVTTSATRRGLTVPCSLKESQVGSRG